MLALFCSANLAADETDISYRLKFGGWSKHLEPLDEITKEDITYNETHNGLGLERIVRNKTTGRYWGGGGMYMKDSYDQHALTLGANYGYSWELDDFELSVGMAAGVQFRSYIKTYNRKFDSIKRSAVPFVVPEVTASYKGLGASLIVFPHVEKVNDGLKMGKPVLFLQTFYNF
ncbi:conserved hypothetical protein [Vibrio chagasii]|nr:conserved hypothetical protein [Vibrio chagasii]